MRSHPQRMKVDGRDFPGGTLVKNLPSNAGDVGSIPRWGTKIPPATGQLNPCATATESARSGAHAPHVERSWRAATREARAPQQRARVLQLRPDIGK